MRDRAKFHREPLNRIRHCFKVWKRINCSLLCRVYNEDKTKFAVQNNIVVNQDILLLKSTAASVIKLMQYTVAGTLQWMLCTVAAHCSKCPEMLQCTAENAVHCSSSPAVVQLTLHWAPPQADDSLRPVISDGGLLDCHWCRIVRLSLMSLLDCHWCLSNCHQRHLNRYWPGSYWSLISVFIVIVCCLWWLLLATALVRDGFP